MTTYSEKLKDPRWQQRRLEKLSQAKFRCERCRSSKKQLQVHHVRYLRGREPWDYTDEQLVALCEDCHELQHLPAPTDEDERREQQIDQLSQDLIAAADPIERRTIAEAIVSLVMSRSQEQVRRMERDRGLR